MNSLVVFLLPFAVSAAQRSEKPNVVVIFMDDQGFADVGCFSAGRVKTPNIDKLAQDGMRMTNFYTAANVSTPSRAGLMTGCYPNRIGLPRVLFMRDSVGLNDREMTMAEMFKQKDYRTACIGKWHLGHRTGAGPLSHGFDEFVGLYASNNITALLTRAEQTALQNTPQEDFTTLFTQESIAFIEKNKSNPFFLYLAHPMPHIPLAVSDKFKDKSGMGLYADVLMEIDWSVGEVVESLKNNGLYENTLIVVTSDNGPWLTFGNHAGSALPFSHGKATSFEGGQHQFCVIAWDKKIKKGSVCDKVTSTIDLLPTFASMIGATLPEHPIDGENIFPLLMSEQSDAADQRCFFYIANERVDAVRRGKWKLSLERTCHIVTEPGCDGKQGKSKPQRFELALFDLDTDLQEKVNLASENPTLVAELKDVILTKREELKSSGRSAAIYK